MPQASQIRKPPSLPSSRERSLIRGCQRFDFALEFGQSFLHQLAVALVLAGIELLEDPLTGKAKTLLFAAMGCLLRTQRATKGLCFFPGVLLLRLHRLALPAACHQTSI